MDDLANVAYGFVREVRFVATPEAVMRRSYVSLAPLLLLLAGCVESTSDGTTTVYKVASWSVALLALFGAAMIVLGFWIYSRYEQDEPGWAHHYFIGGGFMVLICLVPLDHANRLELDEDHFTLTFGLPWERERRNIRFAEIREIRIRVTEKWNRYSGTTISYDWICQFRNGGTVEVPVITLMKEASAEIITRARKKGVVMVDAHRLPREMRP